MTLTAIELSEPNQSVVWRQLAGPDVTDGAGMLRGNDATFTAPDSPTGLLFRVDVTGRGGDVAIDEVRVDVFEDADESVFVHGAEGSDDGDGSRERPFRTLQRAIAFTSGSAADIYLRTFDGEYPTGDGVLEGGTSLYGGYVDDWVRNLERPTAVSGTLLVFDSDRATVSALLVRGADAAGDDTAYGMVATGVGDLVVELSAIRAGDAASGPSVGLATQAVGRVLIVASTVEAGRAGAGRVGSDGVDAGTPGEAGASAPADPPRPGDGGGNGGAGGAGGAGLAPGERGELEAGGAGGEPGADGDPGDGGRGGSGGDGGRGGVGVATGPRGANGLPGQAGGTGAGGGGGGGGGGLLVHDGGGAGGGGGGGLGGAAGEAGLGGHGSVGAWLVATESVVIRSSSIVGGVAGSGGTGGAATAGGAGGIGGDGALGVESFLDRAGAGGGGGGGGAGGSGGAGGGGAGGRSVGLLTDEVGSVDVSGSLISGGAGARAAPAVDRELQVARGVPATVGSAAGEAPAPMPPLRPGRRSSGGDSVGWWDTGDVGLTIADTTVEGGSGGDPGGDDGTPGRSIDTIF